MRQKFSRRDFLVLSASLGISYYAANFLFGDKIVEASTGIKVFGSNKLSYAKGLSPGEQTKAVINKLGGINKFVSPGDLVVLKPNIAWDRAPGYGANTSPEIVGTIAKLCKDAGAKKVKIIDNPCVDARISYGKSGMNTIAKAVGADIHYLDERTLKEMNFKGNRIKMWPVYTEFVETDKLINIPIAKNHGSTKLSLGMKNWLGSVGGNRGSLHKGLHQSIADLATFFKPDLTVVDLTRVLVDNGPQGGSLDDVRAFNTVIAGIDVVAVDAMCTKYFDLTPEDVNYIKLGYDYGLGDINYQKYLNAQ